MVRYHRAVGGLAWLAVTLHMLFWLIKWGIEGYLWHNLTSNQSLYISPHNNHWDNFTIPIATVAWVGVTLMILVALFARRRSDLILFFLALNSLLCVSLGRVHFRNYELFYYTHQFSISFLLACVVHAWTFWYFAAGGATL